MRLKKGLFPAARMVAGIVWAMAWTCEASEQVGGEAPVVVETHAVALWTVEQGPDGRAVAVPPGGRAIHGTDGRIVAVPPGWSVEFGLDGRAVAVPPGGKTVKGMDERLIAVPAGWSVHFGRDGRAVAVPPEGKTASGGDERLVAVPAGWDTHFGRDGRAVAVPPNARVEQGPDERKIAVPDGWMVAVGINGRAVAVPPGGQPVQGEDGLVVAVPPPHFTMDDLDLFFCLMVQQALIPLWIVDGVPMTEKQYAEYLLARETLDEDDDSGLFSWVSDFFSSLFGRREIPVEPQVFVSD